jgi:hypothetical protein
MIKVSLGWESAPVLRLCFIAIDNMSGNIDSISVELTFIRCDFEAISKKLSHCCQPASESSIIIIVFQHRMLSS